MNTADRMKAEALAIFDGSECPQETRDVIEWYHASMLAQQEQAGWQLVPVEPTEAMLDAARACAMRGAAFATWNRMLTAAPKGEKP